MSSEVKNSLLEFFPDRVILTKDDGTYKSKLCIINVSQEFVAVKIKSNNPDIYVVKPKTFVVEPLAKKDIQFLLKADLLPVLSHTNLGST